LEYGHILVGIKSVFLHEIAQGEIGRRAEAGDADGFPFQVCDAFYLRESHHIKRRHVGDAANEDEVSAAKHRTDDWRSAGKRDLGVAGEHDSGHLKRGGNVDQFHLEAILRKELLLRGIPKRSIDPADGRIDDV
jgi:hypothetical protein